MPDQNKILVFDTSCLMHYLFYYYFDKYNINIVNKKLFDFIVNKIESGEIIIIDKVFKEFVYNYERKELINKIKPFIIDTLFLSDEVQLLIQKYKIQTALMRLSDSEQEVELNKYENTIADLWLVAYCNSIKLSVNTYLVSDESTKKDNKIVEKIPTICKNTNENINYRSLPDILFKIYKDELKFNLETN